MLKLLRQHSQSWLIWAIFIVLILVFIFFFGPQTEGFAPGGRTWAVQTPVDTIYDRQLHRTMDRIHRGPRLADAEYARRMERLALDMATVRVLAERARHSGLELGDTEVMCYIVNWSHDFMQDGEAICEHFGEDYATLFPNADFPVYSDVDGRFSLTFRDDVRRNFEMSVEEYQIHKGNELLALKYLQLLERSLAVPPSHVEQVWERRNTEVSLEYVALRPSDDAVEFDDAQVEDFIAEESDLIAAYYADHPERFKVPRSVRLQRIYLRKPTEADEAAVEATRARAQSVLDQAREAGADFDALVAEHTELAHEVEDSGDMGMRELADHDSAIREAVEGIGEGEVALVEQTTSFSVVRLAEDVPASTRTLEDVQAEIANDMLTEEALSNFEQELADVSSRFLRIAAENGWSFEETLASEEFADVSSERIRALIDTSTTDSFAREGTPESFDHLGPEFAGFNLPAPPADEVPGIGRSGDLVRIAFALSPDEPVHMEPVDVDGTPFLVRLSERDAAGNPSAEERDRLQQELRQEMAAETIDFENTRLRLLFHADQVEAGPYARAALEAAIANDDVRLRSRIFEVDPVADLEDDIATP